LQKTEVRVVSQTGDANDRQRAGLGGDNRESNSGPGNALVCQEVVAQGALALAEAQAEKGYTYEVESDNGEI
jgi:hypothetical protein